MGGKAMLKTKNLLVLLLIVLFVFAQLPMTVAAQGENGLPTGGEVFAGQDPEEAKPDGQVPSDGTQEQASSEGGLLLKQGGEITAFVALPEELCRQETRSPLFPETVEGVIGGETVQIPVTWEADGDYDAGEPREGEYVFMAVLAEGYWLADGVELPRIIVSIPPAGGMDGSTEDNSSEVTGQGDQEELDPEEWQIPVVLAEQNNVSLLQSNGSYFEGSGENKDDPYLIKNAKDLEQLATLVNSEDEATREAYNGKYYKLTQDIQLANEEWTPIGMYIDNDSRPFKGHFDGGGHSITGLAINRSSTDNLGLFGYVFGGTIENVHVEVDITGGSHAGGVAGYVEGKSTVQNCISSGSIEGNKEVGGVAGGVSGETTVQNCYSTASVTGTAKVGGVVGHLDDGGTVVNCVALNPEVNGSSEFAGRVAGDVSESGSLSGCYAFEGLELNGEFITGNDQSDNNGQDVRIAELYEPAFWTAEGNWSDWDTAHWDDDIWDFGPGRLPILKEVSWEQSGIGNHLSGHIAGTEIDTTAAYVYTGTRVDPVVINYDGQRLEKGIDYDYTILHENGYSDGINSGPIRLILEGKGSFKGKALRQFTMPKSLQDESIAITVEGGTFVYDGREHKPSVIVQDEGTILEQGKDYEISYEDNTNAGTAKVIISGKGNYRDEKIGEFTIQERPAPGGGGGGSSSRGRNTSVEIPKPETKVSGNNTTATITAKATMDERGKWTAAFSLEQVKNAINAINEVIREAEIQGEGTITNVVLKVEAAANATAIETTLPKEAVTQLAAAGISTLTITTPTGSISFDANTLSGLAEEAAGDLKVSIFRVDKTSLSPEVLTMIGDRPVYDITVASGEKEISQFGGDVKVSLPYTPEEGEDINAIVIYYINETGELEIVTNCLYDPATGMVTFTTRHFSRYAVGYRKIAFRDVAENAWYSKAVTFIAAREIATGTGDGNFSPEAKLTRGQFIVMLMKAYGIKPDKENKDNFADGGDTYYTGYLAAARRLGIAKVSETICLNRRNTLPGRKCSLFYTMDLGP